MKIHFNGVPTKILKSLTFNRSKRLHINTIAIISFFISVSSSLFSQCDDDIQLLLGHYKSVEYNSDISPEVLTISVNTNSIDSIVINPLSDYCENTGVRLTFLDDGLGDDKVAGDQEFTANKSVCFKNPSQEAYRVSGNFALPQIFFNDGSTCTKLFINGYSTINKNQLSIDTTINVTELIENEFYFFGNVLNIVRDKTYSGRDINFVNRDIRDSINTIWSGYSANHLVYISLSDFNNLGRSFFFNEGGFDISKISGNISSPNIFHEITHRYVDQYTNAALGFPDNSGHWGFVERPKTMFGKSICRMGVMNNIIQNGSQITGTEVSEVAFNDLELALMGLIETEEIQFPIRYIQTNASDCNDDGSFAQGAISQMSEIEFNEKYNSLDKSKQFVDSLAIKYVFFTEEKLTNLEFAFYNYYIDELSNSFNQVTQGLGYFDSFYKSEELDLDGDGFISSVDCDDMDSGINPGQLEMPYNGLDDDCDPTTLDDDLDQDGFALINDCDDMDSSVNPSQAEVPYNGLDDDCDPTTLDDDLDQDGFALIDDCDDMDSSVNPSQAEVPYNGLDDDCDPTTLDDDLDQDGFASVDDCDDGDFNINPDATEIPNNGIDEDCDGQDTVTSTYDLGRAQITIYPNPATDIIFIKVDGSISYQTRLFDLNGRLIKTATNNSSLQIKPTLKGVFLLEIEDISTNQKIVERIIIGK